MLMARRSSLGRIDRFELDQRPWLVFSGRPRTALNCNLPSVCWPETRLIHGLELVLGRSLGCCGVSEGEPLIADGVTQGIVRIGDTVRRPLRPFSLTVQAYLAHLRDVGFAG